MQNEEPQLLRLERLKKDCGCTIGSLFMLAALVCSVRYFFFVNAVEFSLMGKIVFCVLILFGSALTGKVIGLGVSRVRYQLLKRKLDSQSKVASSYG